LCGHTVVVQQTPAFEKSAVGVCYVTAVANPDADISDLVVRFVITRSVASSQVSTRHVRGYDAACAVLRNWMTAMCQPPAQ